jgi:hypothetical protein
LRISDFEPNMRISEKIFSHLMAFCRLFTLHFGFLAQPVKSLASSQNRLAPKLLRNAGIAGHATRRPPNVEKWLDQGAHRLTGHTAAIDGTPVNEHQSRNSSVAFAYERRVFAFRILAVRNSRDRMRARSSAAAMSRGSVLPEKRTISFIMQNPRV